MKPTRAAVVDIGTNSVLLTIAGWEGKVLRPELERATITRLGEGVDQSRRLAPAAVERTLACLREYGALIRAAGVDLVALVGTSALRDASGGEEFLHRASAEIQAPAEVISGAREAELTFRGALTGLPGMPAEGPVTVFDIGGGSTEVILGETRSTPGPCAALSGPALSGLSSARPATSRPAAPEPCASEDSAPGSPGIHWAHSFDVGSVRLTERHVRTDPPTPEELDAIRADVRAALASAPVPGLSPAAPGPSAVGSLQDTTVVGVAGTVTTLAAIALSMDAYDPNQVHGARLTAEAIATCLRRLAALPLAERQQLPGLEPRRADVIVAGAVLCSELLSHLGTQELLVSDRGVRWGLISELLDARAPS
jgi:exopolyphosphatase / guanosine-5'-triphosphate,3'-diphosphate pyrophosphatase